MTLHKTRGSGHKGRGMDIYGLEAELEAKRIQDEAPAHMDWLCVKVTVALVAAYALSVSIWW